MHTFAHSTVTFQQHTHRVIHAFLAFVSQTCFYHRYGLHQFPHRSLRLPKQHFFY